MTRNISDDASNTDKTTLVAADRIPIIDSATNPNSLKEATFTNFYKSLNVPYEKRASFINASPADSTVYYFGAFGDASIPTTTNAIRRVYIAKAGILVRAEITLRATGTAGSSETTTFAFRLNDTSDTTLSTAVTMTNSVYHESVTGLSVTVAAGDYFEIKMTTPAWVTNPTAVYGEIFLLFNAQ